MGKNKVLLVLLCYQLLGFHSFGQGDIRDAVASVYTSQIGVKETWGNNAGPEIREYQAACGYPNQSVAWCACLVTWVYKFCGLPVPNEHPALSSAWFPEEKCVYRKNQRSTFYAKRGDLIGLYFRNKGRIAHIGFFHSYKNGYVLTVEGNTSDVGSQREGDRVMVKRRFLSTIYRISNWIDEPEVTQIKYHTMRPGQNLYRLSLWYGVTVEQIMEWNGLKGSDIKVGDVLIVNK